MKDGAGSIWYGLHFYPGVAEYRPPGKDPFRVFINEATIRAMGPTFAGRPVFAGQHVKEFEKGDRLREDADGWVVESFYNEADGKHWVKFIIVTEDGENAIKQGLKLSNAYNPENFGQGGVWNGVDYDKEVLGGVYNHLALVSDPRYDESMVLSPEQFKRYNDEKRSELLRLANEKEKGSGEMKIKFFKRAVLENSVDLEGTEVELPKSKRQVTLAQLVNEADEADEKKKKEEKEPPMANMAHMVECNGKKMTLNDFMAAHKTLNDELEAMKARHYDDVANGDKDDAEAKKKAEELAAHEEKEMKERHENEMEALRKKHGKPELTANELEARRAAKKKADELREAEERHLANEREKSKGEGHKIESTSQQVQRGREKYGSGK